MNPTLVKLIICFIVTFSAIWIGAIWFLGESEDEAAYYRRYAPAVSGAAVSETLRNAQTDASVVDEIVDTGNANVAPGLASSSGQASISSQAPTLSLGQEFSQVRSPSPALIPSQAPTSSQVSASSPALIPSEAPTSSQVSTPSQVSTSNSASIRNQASTLNQASKAEQTSAPKRPQPLTNAEREAARRARLIQLGVISKPAPEPTTAIDIVLQLPQRCEGHVVAKVPVGLDFRFESSSIKGHSLNELEKLVRLYKDCKDGRFVLSENPLGRVDRSAALVQVRLDEVKYFFIQHSVSIESIEFPPIE